VRATPGLAEVKASLDPHALGSEMHGLAAELYPICRSITGDGVRRTLARIGELIPLEVEEVPTGTQVLDWTVPKEWNIREAFVRGPDGRRVVDFADSNLHVVSYSVPVRKRLPLGELEDRLFTLPDRPDWIPYRTSYYNEEWGFCLSHRALEDLPEGEYEVCIDSSLEDGSLTYGECYLEGESPEEVFVSCHVCHPSLANDNLSGIAVAVSLARALASASHRYSYRFVFVPGTIGSISWLARNEERTDAIKHGLVLTCVGDPGHSTYKRSRRGHAEIDRAMEHVLEHSGQPYDVQDFFPYGYDERQYCSPGFDLPVGCLMRSPHGTFPEYHTSADDLELIRPEHLADTLVKVMSTFDLLERNRTYLNLSPKGEPQLGRRGLYGAIGGQADRRTEEMAMLWVLNQSDGSKSLLDIAVRASMPFEAVARAAERLQEHELLRQVA
jgi:aminopeptidase-like protein